MDGFEFLAEIAAGAGARPFAVALDDGRSQRFANVSLPEALFAACAKRARAADGGFTAPRGVALHTESAAGVAYHLLVGPGRGDAAGLVGRFRLLARAAAWRLRAGTDGPTGLANKSRFLEELDRRLEAARDLAPRDDFANPRPGDAPGAVALVLFDIDRFKKFNDDHGHLTGDLVLAEVAACFGAVALERGAFPARFGGEEFAAILSGTDLAALDLAERIRLAVAAHTVERPGRQSLSVTVSLGVAARRPAPGDDLRALRQALIDEADAALYAAKESGRNRSARFCDLRRSGRVLERAAPGLAVVLPGPRDGARPGDVYRVVDGRFDGRRALLDPETGKPLGVAPSLLKGRAEIVAASGGHPGSERVSVARARDFAPGVDFAPGDRLELEETRPAYPCRDLHDPAFSLADGSPRTAAEAAALLPAAGEFALVAVPGLADRRAYVGPEPLRDSLLSARAALERLGLTLTPLSSDKCLALPRGRKLPPLAPVLEAHGLAAFTGKLPGAGDEETLLAMKGALDAGRPLRSGMRVARFDDRFLVHLARACIEGGRLAAAGRALGRCRERGNASWLNAEAARRRRLGDRRAALELFARAARILPDLDNLLNLGTAAMEFGDHAAALAAFRAALRRAPRNAQARNNLAVALLRSGGPAGEALAHAERAAAAEPEPYRRALYEETAGEALHRLGRHAEAAARLEGALARRPDLADARALLAASLSALGREAEAAAARAAFAPEPAHHFAPPESGGTPCI